MTKDDQKSSARAKPRAKPLDQDDPDGHDYCDGSDDTDGHTYREDHDDVDDRDDPNGYDDHDDHDNPDDQDVPDDHDDHDDHDNPDDQDVPDDHDDRDDPDGHIDRNYHNDSRDDSLDKEPGCANILLIQLMSFECILCVLLKGSNTLYSPYSHPTHQHIPIPQCTNTSILEYIHITRISIAVIRSTETTFLEPFFILSTLEYFIEGASEYESKDAREPFAAVIKQHGTAKYEYQSIIS
ncbi:hypothetical protein CAPTEDRAFT_197583 [Capitella teleta]|uniref:Uncharacterized protein n=1 Tax=Capitella teleta TaxID=283909 RepID=R7V8P3_CAPTE|nr:hypothetical protein CAPTEDRAFT_197583 [Capitella teleta]|eukprot:ELU14944.1 hypothetical protein CAPTEDRAFT_197583 [Capitella teleta]